MSIFSAIANFFGGTPLGQVAPWAPVTTDRVQQDASAWMVAGTPAENRRIKGMLPTGSMRPYFDAGDIVGLVAQPPLASLQIGALVQIVEPQTGIAGNFHVVTAIDIPNASIMVQGENNAAADGWQPYSNVLGVCAAVWFSNTPSPVLAK